jgi:hypothetical protein
MLLDLNPDGATVTVCAELLDAVRPNRLNRGHMQARGGLGPFLPEVAFQAAALEMGLNTLGPDPLGARGILSEFRRNQVLRRGLIAAQGAIEGPIDPMTRSLIALVVLLPAFRVSQGLPR